MTSWPRLPCPGIRQAFCGYMLEVTPWGPEWCPGCERTFTAAEQRELHERTIHGWPTSQIDYDDVRELRKEVSYGDGSGDSKPV